MSLFYSADKKQQPGTAVDNYSQLFTNAFTSLTDLGMQYFSEMIAPKTEDSTMEKKEIFCVSFNQDCSCLAVGHEDGYNFYSLRSIDRLEKLFEGKAPDRACILERLYLSSLITIVSMKSTRKLQVYHSIKENEICTHTYASAILAVRMNRKRVVVCLEDSIHIHNVRDMRLMHMIKDTPSNPQGIMDLSNDESACYLAFPNSSSTGHVMVYDADDIKPVCNISAHAGALAAVRFNSDGTKLATASDKGTVIRVFGIPNGERLFEFTRGVKRCVSISSLAFSVDSKYLCLSSNTETIHVFALVKPETPQEQTKQDDLSQDGIGAWMNPLTSFFSQQASAYLPTHMNELMLREKSVATARLPIAGTRTVVAMPRVNNIDYLLVASADGYLFCYTLDTDGGECTLMRQYKIGPHSGQSEEEVMAIPISARAPPQLNPHGVSGLSELDFSKSPSPTQPSIASLRAGGTPSHNQSGGSSSSSQQSQSPPLRQSPPATKPVPPPIPPAPKKRNTSSVVPSSATSGRGGKSNSASTNPFDMDEGLITGSPSPVKKGGAAAIPTKTSRQNKDSDSDGDGLVDIIPPADLDDMDEFPPLNHFSN